MRLANAILILVFCLTPAAWAQNSAPPAAPAATGQPVPTPGVQPAPVAVQPVTPVPTVPTVKAEGSIFKRTPVIDGKIDLGEWDTFYSFEFNDLKATTYVNWDEKNLYIGSKTSKPTDLLVILDANGDGWFHGLDNYEFMARHGQPGESPTLSVSRYESKGDADAGGAPLTAADAAQYTMKTGAGQDNYTFELEIPASVTSGLDLRADKKIGLKVAVGTGNTEVQWIPAAPLGEVQPVALTVQKSVASAPLKMSVKVLDKRLAAGEEIIARISVKNEGNVPSNVDALVIGGEGKTAKLLGSQLVRLDGIAAHKEIGFTFHSAISKSAKPGSAALGFEARAGEQRIASTLVSFEVVPSHEIGLDLGPQPVERGMYHRIGVVVKNNMKKETRGRIKLNLPKGWSFRRSNGTKDFSIPGKGSEQSIVFRVKPPETAEGGAPVLAEVQVGKDVFTASGILQVK